jgi:hypothetical protein
MSLVLSNVMQIEDENVAFFKNEAFDLAWMQENALDYLREVTPYAAAC